MTRAPRRHRDAIAIGASAGGVGALRQLLSELPPDLPASLFVVQHLAATPDSHLVDLLGRVAALPVQWAAHGEPVAPGRVYVAPPDSHLLLDGARTLVVGGARENHARPSINRLFRSAAATYGNRTVGVVLTGKLDDGTAGLRAIRTAGGTAVVQEPAEAEFPDMPRNALAGAGADHVTRLGELPRLLVRLVDETIAPVAVPAGVSAEAALDRADFAEPEALQQLGPQLAIACPTCDGPMWQLGDPGARTYRCYLGHAFSERHLLASQSVEVERALWSAVRVLQERATTLRALAADARAAGHHQSAIEYERRADETHADAARAREFVLGLRPVP